MKDIITFGSNISPEQPKQNESSRQQKVKECHHHALVYNIIYRHDNKGEQHVIITPWFTISSTLGILFRPGKKSILGHLFQDLPLSITVSNLFDFKTEIEESRIDLLPVIEVRPIH